MPDLLAKYRVPGAVVSCITNGAVAWTKAFGRANLKTGAPMQPDMVFNHGSNGKVLTVWGIMRLVEQGKVELDAPANRYLKRWQLRSSQFDPAGVTIRRLLTHRAGLTVHGILDYDQRRPLPTLVEILEGKNQIQLFGEVNGPVVIKWQPGSTNVYSGGGFVLLQMIIEDVTGEPFAAFMQREVTAPLGLNVKWVWTPQLEHAAPMPYGELQEEIGYRQLASQAIGSELCTVPDFARFVAAFTRREGFVVANNSSQGYLFQIAMQKLWLKTVLGVDAGTNPEPGEGITPRVNRIALKIAVGIGSFLFVTAVWCGRQIARGKRRRAWPGFRRGLRIITPPILATLVWWYVFYAPRNLPLPLPPSFLSIWLVPFVHYVTALLLGWMGVALLFALFPRRRKDDAPDACPWNLAS